MAESLRESEPENWYRGVHEAGHAVVIWALRGVVTLIEVRQTHFEGLDAAARAIVAKAGVAAERLFENPAIDGCGDDDRKFTDAIDEIRRTEGEDTAHQLSMRAVDESAQIVAEQRAAIEALADPIGKLIRGSRTQGTTTLNASQAENIARPKWSGPLPKALLLEEEAAGQDPPPSP